MSVMQSFTGRLAVFVLGWAIPGLVQASGFSDSTLNLVSMFNGDYDNSLQFQHEPTEHALISFRLVPVDIPFLRPAFVWYLEWAADGKVLHMYIGTVTEGQGDNIYITLFNFTDPSLYTPREFNVSTVSNLKPEDLKGNNCTAVFKGLAPTVFVGYWPDCRTVVRKHHPDYADTIMCDEVSIILPPTVQETFAPVPYVFRRQGRRYPLIGIPDTYDRVCGKKV